jgi:MOSC domain-containing protein YiiM
MVHAGPLGLAGDEQADLNVHGGPDKAVYFYPAEHYQPWSLDAPRYAHLFIAGAFGENVTMAGLKEHDIAIGDVFRIGSTEMQVTQPRQPCFKLGLRFADNTLGRIMMQSGRTGWYVRVLQPGSLQAGDEIAVIRRPSPQWTIARFNEIILRRSATIEELQELSNLESLPLQWREGFERTSRERAK